MAARAHKQALEVLECALDLAGAGFARLSGTGRLLGGNGVLKQLLADVPGLRRQLPSKVGDHRLRLHDRAGLVRELSVHVRLCPDDRPLLVVRDVSEAGHAMHLLRSSEDRFRRTFEASPVGMGLVSARSGLLLVANPSLAAMLGTTETALAGVPLPSLLAEESGALDGLWSGGVAQVAMRAADGSTRWAVASQCVIEQADADDVVLLQVQDVTERVLVERRLEHQADHDPLTGLPNRRLVVDHLDALLATHAHGVGVLFLDVDGFKQVNDTYGHEAGDRLLSAIARRLESVLRPGDEVARLGGDEFVVVTAGALDHDELEGVARRIEQALAAPVVMGETRLAATVSLGATRSRPGQGPEDVLRDADTAMYRAKAMGRNRWEVYDDSLQDAGLASRDIEERLRQALLTGGLSLHYQVVVDHAGRVHGVEALARISDGVGAYLPTQELVAVAEHDGLIAPLGARVLDLAVAQAAHWVRAGTPTRMAVNVSTRQVARHDLTELVVGALERHGLDAGLLELEVTETTLLQAGAKGLSHLRALREAGVGVAIDDYGTGHASLAYLHDLPATTVKVDRRFVAELPHDRRSAAIVRAVAQMAGDLGMTCVAEGVEDSEQSDWLEHYAPNALLQGYLLGAPGPAEEILLRGRRHRVARPRSTPDRTRRA